MIQRSALAALAASILIMLAVGSAPAQTADARLAAIRALSADVQARIAAADKEAEGGSASGFYCTEVFVNSRNGAWRAVGNYFKKIRFWHTDQPEFAVREGKAAESALAKVEIDEAAAARSSFRDFLFADGKLAFAFIREKTGDGTLEERRYYFDDGKLFRFQLGTTVKAEAPDAAAVLAEAAALQAQLLALFR